MDEAGDGGVEEDGNSVKKEEEQMVRTPEFCVLVHFQLFLVFKYNFCSHSNKFFLKLPSIVGTPRPPFSRRLRTPVCKQISLPPSFTFRPPSNEPPYEDDQGKAPVKVLT